jgi:hypothetical protein
MKDRLASLLSGAWLMGSLMMFVVAPTNFRLVDELLAHSENQSFRSLVDHHGSGPTRELLRYLSSELNREFFLRWNIVQVLLGAALLLIVSKRSEGAGGVARFQRQRRRVRLPLVFATVLVSGLLIGLTPLITSVGRSLDFVPREPPPPELGLFKLLHVGYTVLELVKVGCVGLAAFWLTRGDRLDPGISPLQTAGVEAVSGK